MSIKLTESGFMPTRYSIMTEEYSISKFSYFARLWNNRRNIYKKWCKRCNRNT